MEETLYRRPLPADAIAFSSPAGRQVFAEALAAGGMDGYFPLAEQFHTQSEPAYCGLGSLVVALNALAIDPGRLWKGPWRWFGEELLDCCVPLAEVRQRGLALAEVACLARCNGADVDVVHANAGNLATWRAALGTASRGEAVLIASYDRGAIGQTGGGHFSPTGGYHAGRDLVLVLDVARFKYPPHWVAAERLWQAMHPLDPATGRARGFMVLRARARATALGFTLKCDGESWEALSRRVTSVLADLGAAADVTALARAVAPLSAYLEIRTPSAAAHREALERARAALRDAPLYASVRGAVGADQADVVQLLLLASVGLSKRADALIGCLPDDSTLAPELANLRAQLGALSQLARELPAAPAAGPGVAQA